MQKHGFSLLHFIVTLLNSFLYRMAGYFKGEKFHEFRELSLIRDWPRTSFIPRMFLFSLNLQS